MIRNVVSLELPSGKTELGIKPDNVGSLDILFIYSRTFLAAVHEVLNHRLETKKEKKKLLTAKI